MAQFSHCLCGRERLFDAFFFLYTFPLLLHSFYCVCLLLLLLHCSDAQPLKPMGIKNVLQCIIYISSSSSSSSYSSSSFLLSSSSTTSSFSSLFLHLLGKFFLRWPSVVGRTLKSSYLCLGKCWDNVLPPWCWALVISCRAISGVVWVYIYI